MQSTTGEQPSDRGLIVIGIFAKVHLLDRKIVRKVPRSNSQGDIAPIQREATVYKALGEHPRIAQCLSFGQTDYVDLKYYPNGDLESYLQENASAIEPGQTTKWFEQIIQGVCVIHGCGVVHSDLALRQYFVDEDLNVRFSRFQCISVSRPDSFGLREGNPLFTQRL
jgi:serine/threonine protein kinase